MTDFIAKLRGYAVRWILFITWQARVGWFFVAPVVVFALFAAVGALSEPLLRWSGGCLQLAGFFLVVADIVGREKLFNVPNLKGKLAQFLSSHPRWPKGVTVAIAANMTMGVQLSANATVRKGHDGTVESRLSALESNLTTLEKEAHAQAASLKKQIVDSKAEMDAKVSGLERNLAESEERLGQALSSGITTEWLAIWFFIIGVLAATGSVEICGWLGSMCRVS